MIAFLRRCRAVFLESLRDPLSAVTLKFDKEGRVVSKQRDYKKWPPGWSVTYYACECVLVKDARTRFFKNPRCRVHDLDGRWVEGS